MNPIDKLMAKLLKREERTVFSGNPLTTQLEAEAAIVREMQENTAQHNASLKALETRKKKAELKRVKVAKAKLAVKDPVYLNFEGVVISSLDLPDEIRTQIASGEIDSKLVGDYLKRYVDALKRR